jgi:hypothetical protein
MHDASVVSVTFEWGIEGDGWCDAVVNMETWVS